MRYTTACLVSFTIPPEPPPSSYDCEFQCPSLIRMHQAHSLPCPSTEGDLKVPHITSHPMTAPFEANSPCSVIRPASATIRTSARTATLRHQDKERRPAASLKTSFQSPARPAPGPCPSPAAALRTNRHSKSPTRPLRMPSCRPSWGFLGISVLFYIHSFD